MAIGNLELQQLGRYRILTELGRGAMGVVYRAEDPSLGRVVALKVVELAPEAFDSKEFEARFYQEAKAAGSLNHPGIITIHDTGREGKWAYIAMEVLDGIELRAMMATERLPIARALQIGAQVAEALEFAHANGVVHRDIKPANIMVLSGDQAKIMDFGIARTRVSVVETQVGVVLGSPRYMSPEQVLGQRVDHRSDIFSLGVMLFEMTAGLAPFSGKDVGELMYAVVNAHQSRPSQFNPAVPTMLDLIIAKAMQKDAAARYQSAAELAADLALCREALAEAPAISTAVGESTLPLGEVATHPNTATNAATTAPDANAGVDSVPTTGNGARAATHADVAAPAFASAGGHQAAGYADQHDATTLPLAATPSARKETAPLLFSRRFNSSAALARLSAPSLEDEKVLANTLSAARVRMGVFRGTRNRIATAMIGVSILGAIVIALY